MLSLRWTDRAVADLSGIAEFISRTSAVYAEGEVTRIDHRVQLLRSHPYMGKHAPEAEDLDVRELVIDNYRVFYRRTPTRSSSSRSCMVDNRRRATSSRGSRWSCFLLPATCPQFPAS